MKATKILASIVAAGVLFSGCATTELQTAAKMSQSVFINPVAKEKRVIFISARNTSGQSVDISQKLTSALMQKGYTITDDPEKATYILMTNILYCDKKSENNTGGAAAMGGMIGAGVGGYNHGSATGTVVGGLIGAGVMGLIGNLTEDEIYQMQVDILIREKSKGVVVANKGNMSGQASVRDRSKSGFMNGFGGDIRRDDMSGNLNSNSTDYNTQSFEQDYIEQRTTMLAEATKMNLTLGEATPILEEKIATQIAGLF